MAAFFGVNGALFEVKCPASADRVSERGVSFTRTLGGKRKAFVGRGSRRSWSLDVGAGTPQDVSTVEALSREPGPLVFISPDAAVGNLLSPQASGFEVTPVSATDAGLVQLPDGTVARSVVHSGSTQVYPGDAHGSHERVPVRHGERLAVGAWGLGALGFSIAWRDAEGTTSATTTVPVASFAGWQWREAHYPVPAWASFVSLGLTGGTQYALPSVSWGATAARQLGAGCPKAVLHSPEFSPIAAHSRLNRSRITYSVTEVG